MCKNCRRAVLSCMHRSFLRPQSDARRLTLASGVVAARRSRVLLDSLCPRLSPGRARHFVFREFRDTCPRSIST